MAITSTGSVFWREGLLSRVGIVYAAMFVATSLLSLVLMRLTALFWLGLILGATHVLTVILKKRGATYRTRAWLNVLALVGASILFYLFAGINPGPVLAFALALVLTTLLLGRGPLILVLITMLLFLLGMTAAMWSGLWTGPMPATIGVPTPDVWFRTTIVSAVFWAASCFSVLYVVGALEQNVQRLREKEVQRRDAEKARREAEAMAAQSQKLEALGQLAAGIAHDFNNALLVLRGWTGILKNSDTPELRQQANEAIDQAIDQSEQLATQLLTFGRKKLRSPRYVSVDALVENTGKTLGRVVESRIKLSVHVEPAGFVFADEGQLQQLMFNLVINARDALPDGGEVNVRSRPATAAETADFSHVGRTSWVVLEVEDNGVGMDAATRERIFEPFFTTKEVGKGTGLGLATVFGIVEQNNGHIRVTSEPGEGSTFAVYFPSFDVAPNTTRASRRLRGAMKQGARIFVIEDDPLARDLLVFTLKEHGYDVVSAGDGDEALKLLDGQTFDVLSADAVFPGASLEAVINRFEAANPGGRVLICSGYLPDEIALAETDTERFDYLPKPFTSEQLAAKVASMLA